MKTSLIRLVLVALAAAVGTFVFSGCRSTVQDSAVPWNAPASWEGQQPGMGQ